MKLGVNQFEEQKIEMLFRRAKRASNMQYIQTWIHELLAPSLFHQENWSRKPAARSLCVLQAKHVLRSRPMEASKCRAKPKMIGRLPLSFMKFNDTQCM